jgi:hypothetical protein
MKKSFVGRLAVLAFAGLGLIGSAGATSTNTDASDIWWAPGEPGWGMQLVNTGTFVFATVFTFDADGTPTWITGELSRIGAAPDIFSGPTYVSHGTYYGAPWNPAAAGSREVGNMTFVLNSTVTGQLTYSVDDVVVAKAVERQPLTLDDYNGTFNAYVTMTYTGCFNQALNGDRTKATVVTVAQNGTVMSQIWATGSTTCVHNGAYAQYGRSGSFTSTGSCSDGSTAAMSVYRMSNEPYMFMARYRADSSSTGCHEDGEIVGVIPR